MIKYTSLYLGSTGRVCRYFTSREGCFLGSECPYLHLQEGTPLVQITYSTSGYSVAGTIVLNLLVTMKRQYYKVLSHCIMCTDLLYNVCHYLLPFRS